MQNACEVGSRIDGKQIIETSYMLYGNTIFLRQQQKIRFACRVLGQLLGADLVGRVADDPSAGQSVACGCVKQYAIST